LLLIFFMNDIEKNITSIDFFRIVRLLDAAHPDLPRTGQAWSPAKENIRFAQKPELSFARTPLNSLDPETETRPPRLNVNFMGMCGPNGPLPLHLTEYVRDRLRNHGDPTLTDFLNIFNHRFISLFYRAWMVNQQALDLDRPEGQVFDSYIGSFFGENAEAATDNNTLPLHAKLFFAGHLASQSRSAEGLESIIHAFFDVPVSIETHVGRWIPMPTENRLRLSGSRRSAARLGETTMLGSRTYDTQLSFRIHLGPMDFSDYLRLLPDGDSFRRLSAWLDHYVGAEFFWDVRLALKASQVPPISLGKKGGQRLGWTTWLHSKPLQQNAADLTLSPPETRRLRC
jgi:type VI secretion system protein ImpH